MNNRNSSNIIYPSSLFNVEPKLDVEEEKEKEEKQTCIANDSSNVSSSNSSNSSSSSSILSTTNVMQKVPPLPIDDSLNEDLPLTVLSVSDPLSPFYYKNQAKFQQSNLQSLKSASTVKIEEPITHQEINYFQMIRYKTKVKRCSKCRIEFDNFGKNMCNSLYDHYQYKQIDSKGNVHVYSPITALLQPCCC